MDPLMRAGLRVVLFLCLVASSCGRPGTAPTPSQPTPGPAPNPGTPPNPIGTYSISGVVREVNGGPLADVVVSFPGSAKFTTTAGGSFLLNDVKGDGSIRWIGFSKAGFHSNYWSVPRNLDQISDTPILVKMQPLFELSGERPVSSIIAEDDLSYSDAEANSFWEGAYACAPCKEIWVRPALGLGGRLHLHWTGAIPLDVWAGGYYTGVVADAFGVAGESDIYLDVRGGLDNILVGLRRRNDLPQTVSAPINFTLTVERLPAPGTSR